MGNRFEALRGGDPPVDPASNQRGNTNKEPATGWRKKGTQKGFASDGRTRTKDQLRESKGGFEVGEGSRTEEERQVESEGRTVEERVMETGADSKKEKQSWDPQFSFGSNRAKPPKIGPAQQVQGGRKRSIVSRPKVISPNMKRKQVTRAHQVVFGAISKMGPLFEAEEKVQENGKTNEDACMETWDESHLRLKEPPDLRVDRMDAAHGSNQMENSE